MTTSVEQTVFSLASPAVLCVWESVLPTCVTSLHQWPAGGEALAEVQDTVEWRKI